MKKGVIAVWDKQSDQAMAALLIDGQLSDLILDPADDRPTLGAIYRAKAGQAMKGQGGIILDLGDGQRGFLKGAKGISQGQMLTVQTTGYAEPGKATPVTQKLLFKSRYAIVTPTAPGLNIARSVKDDAERDRLQELAFAGMLDAPEDFGLILRSAAKGAEADAIAEDIDVMREAAMAITADASPDPSLLLANDAHAQSIAEWTSPLPSEWIAEPEAFETLGIWDHIETARGIETPLPSGGSFTVEPTRALTAVDVNTGTDFSLSAGLNANLETIKALPRALRLRGLGGQVTVDFAPAPKKDRRRMEQALQSAFRTDTIETTLVGWTPLGHFELRRKRARLPLTEVLPE